jgi:hypothetical protein
LEFAWACMVLGSIVEKMTNVVGCTNCELKH